MGIVAEYRKNISKIFYIFAINLFNAINKKAANSAAYENRFKLIEQAQMLFGIGFKIVTSADMLLIDENLWHGCHRFADGFL